MSDPAVSPSLPTSLRSVTAVKPQSEAECHRGETAKRNSKGDADNRADSKGASAMNHTPETSAANRPRRWLLHKTLLVGSFLIGLAVTVAACGGGSPNAASTSTSVTGSSEGSSPSGVSNSQTQEALKYAQCMRSHGVTNYADPAPGKSQSIGQSGIDTNSPTYQAAATACQP